MYSQVNFQRTFVTESTLTFCALVWDIIVIMHTHMLSVVTSIME